MSFMDLLERLMGKLTSGRFIFTCVVAAVFAHLAINGLLKEDKVMEVTLIVLYAYFTRPDRVDQSVNVDDTVGNAPGTTTTTTTTLPSKPS